MSVVPFPGARSTFNRTSVELKFGSAQSVNRFQVDPFNRTSA